MDRRDGVPRTCGDDPVAKATGDNPTKCSPHMRG